ncbi:oxidoreductase [Actinoplanes sp. ATCC 53533]|uniref:FAD-dependent oxidoreductase n=1 Tax=Actinoplanes sp. ATCC 53533 TaxID=1288362 RepID=UPI000F7AB82F|nr:NAD(P)/FAD-dependent oxidoreductase [Actinoplanes sp. ATCC 53533]RSM69610.1 oxidoreductase [Actinoplanes sp. ATCC 53533]
MRVIIAGGGLVGLTAALALHRDGAEVLVHEQATEIRAVGAAIGLWRNALDVFTDIGLGDGVQALGTTVHTWFYDAAGHKFRAPGSAASDHTMLLLPRPELTRLLADAVTPDRIRLGSAVTGFDERPDGVTVHFADGTTTDADLLIGADGVHSRVREHLLPGSGAEAHAGHHAWRAVIPTGDEPPQGSILTVGHHRTRGGYTRTYGGNTTWMVNQFDCPPLTGTLKEQALRRAGNLNDNGWGEPLRRLIERTPDDRILRHQIMVVPRLPRFTDPRVALIGDAAHGLSPHISAGGTLGIEDVGVLSRLLTGSPDVRSALAAFDADRLPRYDTVHKLSAAVEQARTAEEYAHEYAAFSHWMLSEAPH